MGEAARGRVEGLEEPVIDGHRGIRQRVQKRGLTGVRVPRERDDRGLPATPCLALRVAAALELLEPAPELADAAPREPAVSLELRLAGAARPDSAAEALEVLPHAAHPGEVVLELCQLDLELAFGARRVLGEDVQDELRTVDHAQLELVLQTALLARIEVVVDDERLGVRAGDRLLQLDELPLSHVGARIRRGPAL